MSEKSTHFTHIDKGNQRSRKTRDVAVFLPVIGVVLLCTPLVSAFTSGGRVDGIPGPVIYIFGVWFILIGCTAFLSRHLSDKDPD